VFASAAMGILPDPGDYAGGKQDLFRALGFTSLVLSTATTAGSSRPSCANA
jgi:hypothetical protein